MFGHVNQVCRYPSPVAPLHYGSVLGPGPSSRQKEALAHDLYTRLRVLGSTQAKQIRLQTENVRSSAVFSFGWKSNIAAGQQITRSGISCPTMESAPL